MTEKHYIKHNKYNNVMNKYHNNVYISSVGIYTFQAYPKVLRMDAGSTLISTLVRPPGRTTNV